MKLAQGYITQHYRDEVLMVGVGDAARRFCGMARANETAAFLIDRMKTETDEAELVKSLCAEYDVDAETAAEDVRELLEQLRSIGAIEE